MSLTPDGEGKDARVQFLQQRAALHIIHPETVLPSFVICLISLESRPSQLKIRLRRKLASDKEMHIDNVSYPIENKYHNDKYR